MNKYTLVVDTSFNLSEDEIKQFDIDVIQIHAYINNLELNVDISEEKFYAEFFKQKDCNVKTSAPSLGEISEVLTKAKSKNDNVIVLTTSSAVSSTYAHVCKVASEQENIYVIDSKGAFAKNKIIFDYLIKNRQSDLKIEQIITNACEIRDHTKLFFIINDLKYLTKNGRIGTASGLIGDILNIKPILSVDDNGAICPFAKVRSIKKAVDKMIEQITKATKVSEVYLATLDDKPVLDLFVERFAQLKSDIKLNYSQVMPAVVGVHSGPKVFIIAFLDEIK